MGNEVQIANGHYRLSARVLCRIIEDEAVLLDLDSGQYYGLNSVGTRIWQLVGAGHPLPAICDLLVQEFQVSKEGAAVDVPAFVGTLLEKRLLVQQR